MATSARRSNQILALRNSYHGAQLRRGRGHGQPDLVRDLVLARST